MLTMVRLALAFAFAGVVVFALSGAVAVALGKRQPSHPALAGFYEGCPRQPCWYGVHPGQSSVNEARRLLRARGLRPSRSGSVYLYYTAVGGCDFDVASSYPSDEISSIHIQKCSHLRLGDVLAVIGLPEGLHTASNRRFWILFAGGRVALQARDLPAWSAHAPVKDIWLINSRLVIRHPWRGFFPRWRYCQLERRLPPGFC